MLNYYEVSEPYYALIVTEGKLSGAQHVYENEVANIDSATEFREHTKKVTRAYAFETFMRADHERDATCQALLEQFDKGKNEALLICNTLV